MIKANHPDLFFGDHTKYASATERTKQLNLAFQYLSEHLEDIGGTFSFVPTRSTEGVKQAQAKSAASPRYEYQGERYAEGFPDLSVTEIFLKSSQIISTGYNNSQRVLYIKFKGNRVYKYDDVPLSVFEKILRLNLLENMLIKISITRSNISQCKDATITCKSSELSKPARH